MARREKETSHTFYNRDEIFDGDDVCFRGEPVVDIKYSLELISNE